MRLIHIENASFGNGSLLHLSLCDFFGDGNTRPAYAILSHRWGEEEILFADMTGDRNIMRAKKAYRKLAGCCYLALQRGLRYVWCDTCCIDKSSSAELSEAINSMYEYYRESKLCIAYLEDIEDDPQDEQYLERAQCCTRGWTLQELIAPPTMEFYSRGWKNLGTKAELSRQISDACGISERILRGASLEDTCVSEKMSWAARRTTTRLEDRAYSLMGLFGVHMPPLYGEGANNAFRRLQLKVLRITTDHTIFAWNADTTTGDMLAPSVSDFKDGSDYEAVAYDEIARSWNSAMLCVELKPDFSMTNAGLHIQLPMVPVTTRRLTNGVTNVQGQSTCIYEGLHFAFLACRPKSQAGLVAICLRKSGRGSFPGYARVVFDRRTLHLIKQSFHGQHSNIDISNFISGWISTTPFSTTAMPRGRVPAAVKTIIFELWLRGLSPSIKLIWSRENKQPEQPHLASAFRRLQIVGDKVLQESTKGSEQPLQHYLKGEMPATGYAHEIIMFQSLKKKWGEAPGSAGIAFGVIDGILWMDFPALKPNQDYDSLFQDYSFPAGDVWRNLGSTIRVFPDAHGTFYTRETGHIPRLFGQIAQSTERPEAHSHNTGSHDTRSQTYSGPSIHSIRIYLSPSPKLKQSW